MMRIFLSRPDITDKEIASVVEVLRGPNLSLGPRLTEFEQALARYLGRRRAVAVNSGTSGLFLSLLALGIGEGDEVITTPFSFVASTTSIMMTGAKPVFVDIDPVSLNLCPDRLEAAITPRTRAILPVEVFGNPAGFDDICRIAERNHLPVVEDSCEALGSALNGKKAGTFGKLSAFGFYPNKQITTGEGGAILTDDEALADLCVSLRNQGRSSGDQWLLHERLGYNFRLSDINCALGLAQLARIDEIKARRSRVARWYQEMLADEVRLIVPTTPPGGDISWFVFVVRLADSVGCEHRDRLLEEMRRQKIQVSNYFPPIHLQPFIAERYGHGPGDFPACENAARRTVALPFHAHLTEDDVAFVCGVLRGILDTAFR
ncbi:MAG: DegT/DnrJ/EryC1/StrS family aminotransferase [Sedimentisphaerales bacterium]|jgi:perosamine synthetase|nr:DegT/DnrJ/EryC1/StrS family aminotransferase [Sedimentisphaerales bacterium]HOC63373.1 DegT/DnrJ/EryC1/StrS family aminotransferase [Sedimentisphaerales bacterium]HOH64097.1 DegT/DnrJ/EryC1/StrS family aminotransferase [Sedimentisphaerales bacterium]HQA90381.1 DegT/DnrJ/EryC1/StrS family aminotransferase [Sedimentisphaerales bacterium]HQN33710.1 DegT/DnrJ/EryC1/StrS family aminotransferase [Sedimentisphaerales bacterium]